MKYMVKCFALVVMILFVGKVSAIRRDPSDDVNRLFETMTSRMEEQFNSMFERMKDGSEKGIDGAVQFDTYAHNIEIHDDGKQVKLMLPVDKSVAAQDVITELDNGVLHVLIERPERIEIFVEDRWLTLTAERRESEKKKDTGSFASISCASQQLTLPSSVDVSKTQADLTNGKLTLIFEKNGNKNRQHITVTQGGTVNSSVEVVLEQKSSGGKDREK